MFVPVLRVSHPHFAAVAAILVSSALAAGLLPLPAAAADIRFASRFESIAVGGQPQAVAAGDLDGDGHTDLLVTHTGANMTQPDSCVRVLMGDGRGGFTVKGDSPTGASPVGLAVADWDRDGKLDVAVANAARGSVSLLLGAGDGTLRPALRLAAGVRPILPLALDANDDGRLDLVVLNLGNGKLPSAGLNAIAEGTVTDSSSVMVFHSIAPKASGRAVKPGSGTPGTPAFKLAATLASGLQPVAAVACDWNADGMSDLVVAERGSSTLVVWTRTARGYSAPRSIAVESAPTDLAGADINGDGRIDLVGSVSGAAEGKASWGLAVWLGGASDTPQITRFTDTSAFRVALGDVDRDGKLDVVAQARDGMHVLRGVGDGTFAAPVAERLDIGSSFVMARVNGDDRIDLVCANPSGQSVSLLYGNETAGFGDGKDFETAAGPSHLTALDVDRDGKLDLVAANSGAGTVSVLRNEGGGVFGRSDVATGDGPTFATGGDVDADGDIDLVVMLVRGRASEVVLLRNRGDGSFDPRRPIASGIDPSSVVVTDINGDGKADVVVPRNNQPEVLVYFGNGDASFKTATKIPVGHLANVSANGDLNGDGKLDFVIADIRKGAITPLLGKGDGTFTAGASIPSRVEPSSLALADTNADGKLDLVVGGRRTSYKAYVLTGVGDGTFGQRSDIAVGPGAGMVALADLDADGRLDLVVPDAQLGAVTVLLRDADGGFTSRHDYGTGIDPSAVVIVDLDGDGRLDIAVSNRGENTVSLLQQTAQAP